MTITPSSGYGTAKFIVSTTAGQGNYTTLASAMAAASSGDTIFMRTSVTENVTITPGVNITGWTGMGYDPTVTITGKLTMTGAGTSTVSNLRLKTNSDFCVAVTGSANSILNLDNCWIDCNNNTGISYTSSGASSGINLYQCNGDTGTTGIAHFAHSGAGGLNFQRCIMSNTGGSTTASTASNGSVTFNWSAFLLPVTTSGTTAFVNAYSSIFNTASQNATCLTIGATNANTTIRQCELLSGTAASISISASCTATLVRPTITSTNANPVTGSGTVIYDNITFLGSGNGINTTTKTISFNAPISYAPTITVLTSGTAATYTTPTYAKWLRIKCYGAGGGGAGTGSSSSGGGGGNGTATTWSGGSLSAGGGGGGAAGGGGSAGSGGVASGGNVANYNGGNGGPRWAVGIAAIGGYGGNGYAGGGGPGGEANGGGGQNGAAPGAGGGGGGSTTTSVTAGTGGGAGGYVEHIIQSPAATYTYTVGAAGAAGSAGTSGVSGGAGFRGEIVVEEYYA